MRDLPKAGEKGVALPEEGGKEGENRTLRWCGLIGHVTILADGYPVCFNSSRRETKSES